MGGVEGWGIGAGRRACVSQVLRVAESHPAPPPTVQPLFVLAVSS